MFELILLLFNIIVANSCKCSAVLNVSLLIHFGLANMDWYEIIAEKLFIKLHENFILQELSKREVFCEELIYLEYIIIGCVTGFFLAA